MLRNNQGYSSSTFFLRGLITYFVMSMSSSCAFSKQPNVLMIVADDYGYHDIGYHGSEILTPNLDKLAGEGVKLENYYVQPVCSPTRSQILSGRYQIHTGLQHEVIWPSQPNGLPLKFPTIAKHLKKQGYSTHAVGKWHLGMYKKEFTPIYRGFDSFFGYLNGKEDYYSHTLCDYFHNGSNSNQSYKWCGFDLRKDEVPVVMNSSIYSTHLYTEKAIDKFKKASVSKKPFFMYLAYQAVHKPLQVPEEYMRPYLKIKNRNRRIYAGMVSAMDEGIGNLTQALKDLELWDNTIVIFTTDNGGQVYQGGNNFPLRGWKASLWEGGIRGVGFVSGPPLKRRGGTINTELMHVSDWFPTIAAMVGAEVNTSLDLDGKNQWPMISQGERSSRVIILHNIDPLVAPRGKLVYPNTFDHRIRAAVRMGDFKLITGNPGDDRWIPPPSDMEHGHFSDPLLKASIISEPSDKNIWLFNIRKDPSEVIDLSNVMKDKVMLMLQFLNVLNASAVPVEFPPSDPACDPKLHGGFWSPWM